MNAGLTIATILWLLMALAGGGSADVAKKKSADEQQQLETNKEGANGGIFGLGIGTTNSPSGVNLNHNETLTRDTNFKTSIGIDCPSAACGGNHNETIVRENGVKAIPTGCPTGTCGGNHNETLVRDTAPSQQSASWSLWLSGERAVALAPLLSQFLINQVGGGCSPLICGSNHNETIVRDAEFKTSIGGGCSPIVCGSNHNETLVRDATVTERADQSSQWLSGEQAFADSLFSLFLTYRIGGNCSPLVCGSNHNETLVRDVAPMK